MPASERPPFTLHDTLSRTPKPVELQEPGRLRMYSCGPTVYSYAHIGNFRTFLTADLILRTAQALGWETLYVTNITDVGHLTEDDVADAGGEDRMAKALASKEGEQFANVWDLARYYAEAVLEDWQALNMLPPNVRPRATEHMREQILAVQNLIDAGHAYETEQGVYFHVPSFAEYGKLSGNRAADALAQTEREVVTDTAKRDPRDFALWKKDEKHLMQWYSPWGWGFPGWHIECSVMAMQYLGDTLDIHAGGEDLRFPHHECEIAQSESLTGHPFANVWVHTRFLQVEGEKMSKSKGNFLTVRQLIAPDNPDAEAVDPLALRYALISGHYRKPFNFTHKNLEDSAKVIARYRDVQLQIQQALDGPQNGTPSTLGSELDEIYERALAAMLEDLNTPVALAVAYEGVKRIAREDLTPSSAEQAQTYLNRIGALLGIVPNLEGDEGEDGDDAFAREIEALISQRAEARAARDWSRADEIRDQITDLGVELMDGPEGTTWRKR